MTARPAVRRAASLLLLGAFQLEIDGRGVHLPLGAQRLLALLGLHGPLVRTRLAATLWPDSPAAQARTNLRHALWHVHAAVPERALLHGADELRLADAVECDAIRVQEECLQLLATGREPTPDGVLAHDLGELLPDWDDEWVTGERERLRQLQLHAWECWADARARSGSYGLALDIALMALRADVLRESAHRTVIRIHRAEGNLSEAQRCLERCQAVLSASLGVPPSAETMALWDLSRPAF